MICDNYRYLRIQVVGIEMCVYILMLYTYDYVSKLTILTCLRYEVSEIKRV